MKEILKEMFSDSQGVISSKRILGALALLASLALTVVIMILQYDYHILMYPYGVSATLLGIGTFESVSKGIGGK